MDQTNANGSHTQTAYQAGQTLISTAGVVDSFKSFGSDTFVFATGFGKDSITGFHAGSARGHDTLLLDIADVSSFADVQSHLTSAGADTLLSLSATDTSCSRTSSWQLHIRELPLPRPWPAPHLSRSALNQRSVNLGNGTVLYYILSAIVRAGTSSIMLILSKVRGGC